VGVTAGAWVLLAAVLVAVAVGVGWTLTNGVFRGTHRVRAGSGGVEMDLERASGPAHEPVSLLAGTAYDGRRGERATLL
jgi:hypothetical protein